jgi:RHS repeat-associated protein
LVQVNEESTGDYVITIQPQTNPPAAPQTITIPTSTVYDSSFDPRSGEPRIGPAYNSLTQDPSTGLWTLTVEVDPGWLTNPDLLYPLYVDPTFDFGSGRSGGGDDTFYETSCGTCNFNVWKPSCCNHGYYIDQLGYYDSSTGNDADYFHYNLGSLNGQQIFGAWWHAHFVWNTASSGGNPYVVHPVSCSWTAGGLTYNNRPCLDTVDHINDSAARDQVKINDVTSWVNNWTDGAWNNNGIEVDVGDTNDSSRWKDIAADENTDGSASFIEVNYNIKPSPATLVSPGNGAGVHTLTPTLTVNSSDSDGDALGYHFWVATGGDAQSGSFVNNAWSSTNSFTVPSNWLKVNTTYYWKASVYDGAWETPANAVWSFTTNDNPPTAPALVSPSDGFIATTTTPELAIGASTDPDSDPLTYDFWISTGQDGQTGTTIQSGKLAASSLTSSTCPASALCWTPPPGSLIDGSTYYWWAQASDGMMRTPDPSATTPPVRSLRVDLGLGESNHPSDNLGPATVNLANGNLYAHTASPTFKAVGGSLGVSYSYNSRKPSNLGLTGYYYNDLGATHSLASAGSPVLSRTDAAITFNWNSSSPYPTVNATNFLVRWVGNVTVPTAGSYAFGTIADDGSRIWVGSSAATPNVLDHWVDQPPPATPNYGNALNFLAGQLTQTIEVDYYQHLGGATMSLYVNGPGGPGGAAYQGVVPASWLTTSLPALPDGWNLSVNEGGAGYDFARIGDKTITLVDATGATHAYTWNGAAWQPPVGEDGVLTNDTAATGLLTLIDTDGTTYIFNADGTLKSAVAAADDTKPAALQTTIAGTPPRTTQVTDPVSQRSITLVYNASGSTCPTPPSGFDTAAPGYMLCKVDYSAFNGGETDLYYSGGHLARIVDPGVVITDFGYDSTTGLLTQIRDPLNNDLIACGASCPSYYSTTTGSSGSTPDPTLHMTVVGYTSGQVTGITAPTTDGSSPRAQHTYSYDVGDTRVHVAGITENSSRNYAREVAYDYAGRLTTDYDLAGNPTGYVWDSQDHLLRTTDATGLVTTHLYDAAGRETATYGPGLASEFNADGTRTSNAVPWTQTRYDEGLTDLAATWWDNQNLAQVPKAHTLDQLQDNWGSSNPSPSRLSGSSFSGRLTGQINMPATGNYGFGVTAGGGARLYIDDHKVADSWGGPYLQAVNADTPYALWRLGDTSGTTAVDAEQSHPGTYVGGVQLNSPGAVSYDSTTAASFNGGSQSVSVPAAGDTVSSAFSVEAWVKPATTSGVLGVFGTQPQNWGFDFKLMNGKIHGDIGTGAGWLNTSADAPLNFQAGTWYDIAYVVQPGAYTVYANGVAVGSASLPAGTPLLWDAQHLAQIGGAWSTAEPFNGSISNVAVYYKALTAQQVSDHYNAAASPNLTATGTMTSLTAGAHRIKVEYQNLAASSGQLHLSWTPPGASSSVPVPITDLSPRLGLVTSGIDAEGKLTTTGYSDPSAPSNADYPLLGLATTKTVDPSGLNLATTTEYEPASTSSYYRVLNRTLPAGAGTAIPNAHSSTDAYYAATETGVPNTCSGTSGVNQGGGLKSETGPSPALITHDYVYDAAGRDVATRVHTDANWTCTVYDARGRVATVADSAGHTTSNDYSVPDRVTTTAPDSKGAMRTTVSVVDWNGRAIGYTDENATVTTTAYDQAGRVTDTTRTLNGVGSPVHLTHTDYDATTGLEADLIEYASTTAQTVTFGYDAAGRLRTVGRPNGVQTLNAWDPNRGWLNSISNTNSGGSQLSLWTYTRTNSGSVHSETGAGRTRTFAYDAAGRLNQAADSPGATRNYTYDSDTNRCAEAATCTTPTYTYDTSDRLTKSPYATSYTYDPHGNLTSANVVVCSGCATKELITYDANDHATSIDDGINKTTNTIAPTGRTLRQLVIRDSDGSTRQDVTFGFEDGSDSPAYSISGGVTSTYVNGPGGLLLVDKGGTPTYQIQNAHGDIVGTVSTGGAPTAYPDVTEFGQGSTGGRQLLWLGGKERFGVTGPLQLFSMGVRLYDAHVGRFLEVDPSPGGSANDYDYCNADPVNCFDLNGKWPWDVIGKVAAVVGGVVGAVACGISVICGVAVGVAAGALWYTASNAGKKSWSWNSFAVSSIFGGMLGMLGPASAAARRLIGDTALANSRWFGYGSRLFTFGGRRLGGALNRNPFVRVGWGGHYMGRRPFRIGFGDRDWPLHGHLDLF